MPSPFAHQTIQMPLLAALAMSVGWGWRGDYGHEAGAMVPGALLALSLCLTAGRADWWPRAGRLALLGAIGWAFGGQMSYGIVIGYTAHNTLVNVLYGFACLFLIGALWGGIGAGVLALGFTASRAALERFTGPLVAVYAALTLANWSGLIDRLSDRFSLNDSDWMAALVVLLVSGAYAWWRPTARPACKLIAQLAAGWWLGLLVLAIALRLRMTPPRSDNWAGAFGVWVSLALYLYRSRNRAALRLMGYGLLAGGIGFAVGDLVNMAGRAQWGMLARSETLRGMDAWKWMEQLFGFIMGFGVALGAQRLSRELEPPREDITPDTTSVLPLREAALYFLFIAMQWENLHKNVKDWTQAGVLVEGLFGLSPQRWIAIVAVLLAAIVALAIRTHARGELSFLPADAFGRAQWLFLMLLWLAVVADFARVVPVLKSKGVLYVHLTFWLTALLCTLIVVTLRKTSAIVSNALAADDAGWNLSWRYWIGWLLVPLLLFILTRLALAMHSEPLPGSHLRFGI